MIVTGGSNNIMTEAEERGGDYPFKLRQSKNVKKLIMENHCQMRKEQTVEGWKVRSAELIS